MSEIMRPITFPKLVNWITNEYRDQKSVFGVREEKFYRNKSGVKITMFGEKISSPIGPAAGPNSQLAQNIVAAYLAGSRFIELKTVQPMDGEELRNCIARPCINATDECYNVEWSTELTVQEAFDEYVKAWFLLHLLGKELGIGDGRDFVFNMSVGYSLEGIQSEKIDGYIEGMKDASKTDVWKECHSFISENISSFKHFTSSDLDGISSSVASSITLSTLHGCPKEEIERIAFYLLTEKNIHTYIKCNPTLLGYEFARKKLDEMGYGYISFDDHHFKNDLQFSDAVEMLKRLKAVAKDRDLDFGVKITNTFPVQIKRGELPGEEMYMSGRSLFPLSINAANNLAKEFDGELPISYSGGADFFNIEEILKTGIRPVTVATTILKPGGYERMKQLAEASENAVDPTAKSIDVKKLSALAAGVAGNNRHNKDFRPVGGRKTQSKLNLFDCAKSPCNDGGCPINQQIPEYLRLVSENKFDEAFRIIAVDNTAPSITGTICDHQCQYKCTRLDYEGSLEIRAMKKIAADNGQQNFIDGIKRLDIKTDKKAAVVGAGPAGIATAVFLRRNGVAVTVFEKRDKPYGIVSHVIPEFRIGAETIRRDFDIAVKTGVEFKFGCDENYSVEELKKEFDFVVLATGAWKRGRSNLQYGTYVMDALEFLEESKAKNCNVELGKSVAVIGGGDVAMDCARAALKAGNSPKVTVVYRRTREFMPASPEEIRMAEEDGVEFIFLNSPEKFEKGKLTCEIMELGEYDQSGRRGIKGSGQKKELEFDNVIVAVGAGVDTGLFAANGVKLDEKGKAILSDANETGLPGVYIAGDCKSGPSTIVRAIADGKVVAKDILKKIDLENDFTSHRTSLCEDEIYKKKGVLSEASKEASDGNRCLNCDLICEICCDVCPNRANVKINVGDGFKQRHQILHVDGMCNECGNCGVFCPHDGNPYKDKLTLFWSEEDFNNSDNRGFVKTGDGTYKLRLEDGSITDYEAGRGGVPEGFERMIEAVEKDYSYCF